MKTKRTTCTALLLLFAVASAFGGQANPPKVLMLAQDGFTSQAVSATAGATRYGSVIDLRHVEMIYLCGTTSCTATTRIGVGFQWLPENVDNAGRPNPICLPENGDHFDLNSGLWELDATSTATYSSNQDFWVPIYVKAPYGRIAVTGRYPGAQSHLIQVRYCLRVRQQDR